MLYGALKDYKRVYIFADATDAKRPAMLPHLTAQVQQRRRRQMDLSGLAF